MNVFSKVTLQGLKKNRTRTIVTIIGVILSAAMIMAVTSFISSLQNYMLQMVIAQNGDWHAKYIDVDSGFAGERIEDNALKNAAIVQNAGYALLDGGQNESKPYLFVMGFSNEAFDTLPVKLTSGRLPQNSSEIVIPEHVESNGGVAYRTGDKLTLELGKRALYLDSKITLWQNAAYHDSDPDSADSIGEVLETGMSKTYTVVGFCERPSFEEYAAPGYTAITKAETGGKSYDVYFKLNSVSKIYEYTEGNAGNYDYEYNNAYLRASGISSNDNYNTVLYSLGGILIALIMIGSVLLIFNSFSISVSERTRQFGILSSVGATKKQLRKSVLFEGACIGIIGIPLGVLAGIGGIGVTLKFVGGIFDRMSVTEVPLRLSVSLPSIVVTVLLGIAVILISSYIPARRAAKKSAIDSIRQTQDIKVKARSVKTSPFTSRLFGLEGMLARKNFKRNKKRYRTTVISLFVSIVLFVSASAFGMYLKQGTQRSFAVSDYDIEISSYDLAEDEFLRLYDKIKNTDSVTEGMYWQDISFSCEVSQKLLTERYVAFDQGKDAYDPENTIDIGLSINFIDDITYSRYLSELGLPAGEYTGSDAKLISAANVQMYDFESKRVVSFDIFKDKRTISLEIKPFETYYEGNSIVFANQPQAEGTSVMLTPVEQKPPGFAMHTGLIAFAPYSLLEEFIAAEPDGYRLLTLNFKSDDPMQAAAQMEDIIKEAGFTSSQYQIYNIAEMQEQTRSLLLIINVFTYGFIILMSLITIANVFNTISTNINLRRREFAMLKSVGMTDRGFNRMMNYECIFYGLKALIYGLPASIGITFLIYKGMISGVDMPFRLPLVSIGVSVSGVFLVVFVTMLYSVSKIKKENTVDALKNDIL